jgi:hypothetical protein
MSTKILSFFGTSFEFGLSTLKNIEMRNVVKIGLICGAFAFSSQVFASVNGDKNPKKQKTNLTKKDVKPVSTDIKSLPAMSKAEASKKMKTLPMKQNVQLKKAEIETK